MQEDVFEPAWSDQTELEETDVNDNHDASDQTWQADIVARCLNGDETAFALVVDRYGNLLFRTAFLVVRDEEEARDIVQDALIQAWKNLHTLRETGHLRAWLLKIVVNRAISLKRQLVRKASLLREQLLQSSVDLSAEIAAVEKGQIEESLDVAQAMGLLPLNQRAILVLFYYHKMTMPEISTLLNVSVNTLKKRLQAALTKLRRILQAEATMLQRNGIIADEAHPFIGVPGRELP